MWSSLDLWQALTVVSANSILTLSNHHHDTMKFCADWRNRPQAIASHMLLRRHKRLEQDAWAVAW
jgi:hypothetical protein